MATGHPAEPRTINKVGLERRGFTAEQIKVVQGAYKTLYRRGLKLDEALAELEADELHRELLTPLLDSIRRSRRGIIR